MPVVGDPPGMAPIAGFGAVRCLRSAAHENLGAHDRHLGKNEKMNFGAQAMQNCVSVFVVIDCRRASLSFGWSMRVSLTRHARACRGHPRRTLSTERRGWPAKGRGVQERGFA